MTTSLSSTITFSNYGHSYMEVNEVMDINS